MFIGDIPVQVKSSYLGMVPLHLVENEVIRICLDVLGNPNYTRCHHSTLTATLSDTTVFTILLSLYRINRRAFYSCDVNDIRRERKKTSSIILVR